MTQFLVCSTGPRFAFSIRLAAALAALPLVRCGGSGSSGLSAPPGPAWPGKASAIAVSTANTCAVASNGTGYCWGANAEQQLTWPHVIPSAAEPFDPCSSAAGGSSYNEWPCVGRAPVPVTGGDTWKTLTYSFSGPLCGVTAAGVVKCYENTTADSATVDYPAGVTSQMGIPICGGLPCWDVPLPLKGGETYTSFAWGFGQNLACGLATSGTALCLGGNGQDGTLGSGTLGEIIVTPRAVAGAQSFTMLTVAFT